MVIGKAPPSPPILWIILILAQEMFLFQKQILSLFFIKRLPIKLSINQTPLDTAPASYELMVPRVTWSLQQFCNELCLLSITSHDSQQLADNQSQIHIFDPEFMAGW